MVIAISKSDAQKAGYRYINESLIRNIDNNVNMARLNNSIGKTITKIGKTPVKITNFGTRSGRPIAVIRVGNKKIPFYISTGTAGKTSVPTGKWEFFGGIDSDGWFRKGTLDEIVNHYNSPELKQIADALDKKIGDLRDTEDILKTIGRKYLGGHGTVARINHAPEIKPGAINRDVFNPQNNGIFQFDLKEIKAYLKNLVPQNNKNKVQELNQGKQSLKDKILSKLATFFNDGNNNDEQ
jgi:hypothetical protein